MEKNVTSREHAVEGKFVWLGEARAERNLFVLFRRAFRLEGQAESAWLHLFADTRYRMFVNGRYVEGGPARYSLQAPEYDSVDLAPYLRDGDNVVAVEVNFYGVDSAEADPSPRPGFVAWGAVEAGGATIDLATPGDWQARRLEAWDPHAPNWSFMNHATEIVDLRKVDRNCYLPGKQETDWEAVQEIAKADCWGPLKARTIPLLNHGDLRPARLLGAYALGGGRFGGLSFRLPFAEVRRTASAPIRHQFAWLSWLYSPHSQRLQMGCMTGRYWLNGHEIGLEALPVERKDRRLRTGCVALREGWNLLYCESRLNSEAWDFHVRWPAEAEVAAHVRAEREAPEGICGTLAIEEGAFEKVGATPPAAVAEVEAYPHELRERPTDTEQQFPARDCAWDEVVRVARPASHRLVPQRLDTDVMGRQAAYVYDMGGAYLGHVFAEVEAPEGTVVDLSYEETLRPDGLVPVYRHGLAEYADRFIHRGGRARLEAFHLRGGRYFQVTLRLPKGASQVATVHKVGVRDATLPVVIEGRFECSDPVLNWTWQMAERTFRVSTTDTYTPDVARERGLAIADNRLQTHLHRVLSSDMRASRRSVAAFLHVLREDGQLNSYAPSMRFVPLADFTLIWPMWVCDHWAATGDLSLVKEALPVMREIYRGTSWQSDEEGLWTGEGLRAFIDWGAPFANQKGPVTAALNAFRVESLRNAAALAEAAGEQAEAEEWRKEAEAVVAAMRRVLWREETGLFALSPNDETPSLHAQILALAFELVEEGKADRLIAFVKQALSGNVEAAVGTQQRRSGYANLYFLFFALQGLYRVGEVAFAEQLIRDHWGYLMDQGAWTSWENILGGNPQSHCHVWNAHPSKFLMENLVGIRQKRPGRVDAFVIEPQSETIDWARGRFPLERGRVDVSWKIVGDQLQLRAAAPESVELEVSPRGRLGQLQLDFQRDQIR